MEFSLLPPPISSDYNTIVVIKTIQTDNVNFSEIMADYNINVVDLKTLNGILHNIFLKV